MTDTRKIMDVADVLAAYLTDEAPEVARLVFNGEIAEMATRAVAVIEGRVRAEVAEEIAVKIEATETNDEGRYDYGYADGIADAAKIARLAAGSSPDTTPEAKP